MALASRAGGCEAGWYRGCRLRIGGLWRTIGWAERMAVTTIYTSRVAIRADRRPLRRPRSGGSHGREAPCADHVGCQGVPAMPSQAAPQTNLPHAHRPCHSILQETRHDTDSHRPMSIRLAKSTTKLKDSPALRRRCSTETTDSGCCPSSRKIGNTGSSRYP